MFCFYLFFSSDMKNKMCIENLVYQKDRFWQALVDGGFAVQVC